MKTCAFQPLFHWVALRHATSFAMACSSKKFCNYKIISKCPPRTPLEQQDLNLAKEGKQRRN